jgi:uncharacterized membrane protein
MNQAESPSSSFSLLQQATTVLLVFQAMLLLARLFADGENSGAMTGILAATLLQLVLTRRLSAEPQGPHATSYVVLWRYAALALFALMTIALAIDTYAPETPVPDGLPTWVAMLMAAMIALKGAVLGKLKPNRIFGLRLRWTRESRLAWELAHRLMGRILFFGGLLGLVVAPFVPFLATLAGIVALISIGVTAGAIESRRVWQGDPERGLAG